LIQSGKPVGVFKTHADAPRVLLANSNLVPKWATWEHFHELDRKGLFMFGQMTAGSWIYIGTQGIVQGTYETFAEAGRQHYGGSLAGKWILTAGLGGMGGAQPLAATFAGAVSLTVVLAAYLVAEGIASMLFAYEHRRQLPARWGWLFFNGIIDLFLAGIIIWLLPFAAVWGLGIIIGIDFIFGGASLIGMAFAARDA